MSRVPAREGRWNLDHAARVHRALDESGMSLAAFARRHEINEKRLRWWRRALRKRPAALQPRIVELVPTATHQPPPAIARLRCPTGHVIELDLHGADPLHGLTLLVRAVQAASC